MSQACCSPLIGDRVGFLDEMPLSLRLIGGSTPFLSRLAPSERGQVVLGPPMPQTAVRALSPSEVADRFAERPERSTYL
jgi:hypothetical protein